MKLLVLGILMLLAGTAYGNKTTVVRRDFIATIWNTIINEILAPFKNTIARMLGMDQWGQTGICKFIRNLPFGIGNWVQNETRMILNDLNLGPLVNNLTLGFIPGVLSCAPPVVASPIIPGTLGTMQNPSNTYNYYGGNGVPSTTSSTSISDIITKLMNGGMFNPNGGGSTSGMFNPNGGGSTSGNLNPNGGGSTGGMFNSNGGGSTGENVNPNGGGSTGGMSSAGNGLISSSADQLANTYGSTADSWSTASTDSGLTPTAVAALLSTCDPQQLQQLGTQLATPATIQQLLSNYLTTYSNDQALNQIAGYFKMSISQFLLNLLMSGCTPATLLQWLKNANLSQNQLQDLIQKVSYNFGQFLLALYSIATGAAPPSSGVTVGAGLNKVASSLGIKNLLDGLLGPLLNTLGIALG